jgi:hypothetical protein
LSFIDHGTDNDDAIEVFIQSIFHGDYPYTHLTQLGNPLSPLPFEPLYSIIFFLIGNVAYQNIVSVAILIAIIWMISRNDDQKIFGYLSISLCIPFYEYLLTQSDNISVVIFILLILFLMYKCKLYSSSVLTGCMIAAKGFVWLIVPAIIVYIYTKTNFKKWILCCCIISIVASIFILPFLIWDANTFINFAPIGVLGGKNFLFDLKYSNYLLPIFYCFISFICALKIKNIFLTTTIVYIVASLTLFDYSAMIICFGISVIGLTTYKNIESLEINSELGICQQSERKPE